MTEIRTYPLPNNRVAVHVDLPSDRPAPWSCTCRTRRIERSDGTTLWIGRHLPRCLEFMKADRIVDLSDVDLSDPGIDRSRLSAIIAQLVYVDDALRDGGDLR